MAIPASYISKGTPAVVSAGGSSLVLNGVMVTKSTLLPTGAVRKFTTANAVKSFFGSASDEYALATKYFLGFTNSSIKPSTLYFAPYAAADRAAWLQSGSLAALTLTQLQDLSGTIIVTVDGVVKTSSSISFATATSFSQAASLIEAAFTGSPLTCVWNSVLSAFILTSATAGASSSMTYATGTLSTALKLTSATSAILSQGAVADTADTCMGKVFAATQNWVTFMTMWEPTTSEKTEFAVWTNAQDQAFVYVAWDTDGQAIVQGSTTCFGAICKAAGYNAVYPISGASAVAITNGSTLAAETRAQAAMTLGAVASIDFGETNGRATMAFKDQSGLISCVSDETTAKTLEDNGYNFYGDYATRNDSFTFLFPGQISGDWLWMDTFVNQVYLNSEFQLANIKLLTSIKAVPYQAQGFALVRAAMMDPIKSGLNFGSIRQGITMSEAQKAEVNYAAGKDISTDLWLNGYYLQILDPGAAVRGGRGSPKIKFWYTDGGAIQHLDFTSIDIM